MTTPGSTRAGRRSRRQTRRLRGWRGIGLVVALGLVALLGLAALDVAALDPTSGGYEPPYTDVTGDPIDWDGTETTATGMVQRGRVLHTHTDCTTGMIRIEVFGLVGFDYRELSDRALAVHDPRTACEERGFAPRF